MLPTQEVVRTVTWSMLRGLVGAFLLLCLTSGSWSTTLHAQATQDDVNDKVERARETLKEFCQDPLLARFRRDLEDAQGLLIIPVRKRLGFFVGVTWGEGVLLERRKDRTWAAPVFYNLWTASLGAQFGMASEQTIYLLRDDVTVRRVKEQTARFGLGAGIALGREGRGLETVNFRILSFVKGEGLYGGIAVEVGAVELERQSQQDYLGPPMTGTCETKERVSR